MSSRIIIVWNDGFQNMNHKTQMRFKNAKHSSLKKADTKTTFQILFSFAWISFVVGGYSLIFEKLITSFLINSYLLLCFTVTNKNAFCVFIAMWRCIVHFKLDRKRITWLSCTRQTTRQSQEHLVRSESPEKASNQKTKQRMFKIIHATTTKPVIMRCIRWFTRFPLTVVGRP